MQGTTSIPPRGDCSTFGSEMDRAARTFGSREAYVDGIARMTFAQWASRSGKLAAELSSRGVGSGDVVALMLAPGIDYAVAYAATLRLGAVVTGLNTRLGRLEVDRILAQCAPALVIYDQSTGLPAPVGFTVIVPRRADGRLCRPNGVADPVVGNRRRSGGDHLDERDDGPSEGRVV